MFAIIFICKVHMGERDFFFYDFAVQLNDLLVNLRLLT